MISIAKWRLGALEGFGRLVCILCSKNMLRCPQWYIQVSLLSSSKVCDCKNSPSSSSSPNAYCERDNANKVSKSSADIASLTLMLGFLSKENSLGKRSAKASPDQRSCQRVTIVPSPMLHRSIFLKIVLNLCNPSTRTSQPPWWRAAPCWNNTCSKWDWPREHQLCYRTCRDVWEGEHHFAPANWWLPDPLSSLMLSVIVKGHDIWQYDHYSWAKKTCTLTLVKFVVQSQVIKLNWSCI